jgi:hypothetical protein
MQSKTPRASGRPAPTLRQVKPNFSSVSCRFQSQRSSDSAKCVGYTEIIATVLEAEAGRLIDQHPSCPRHASLLVDRLTLARDRALWEGQW